MLGRIGPQLGRRPAASLLKVLEQNLAITQAGLPRSRCMRKHMDEEGAQALAAKDKEEGAQALAAKLATVTWTHDYSMPADEANGARWRFPRRCPTSSCR